MVGAGRQSRGLIEAHMHIHPIRRVSIWSRTSERAEATADACARVSIPAQPCRDLEAAVASAAIVSCATLATTPVIFGEWLRPGVHLDLVGAFKKDMRETDDAVMSRADLIIVDGHPDTPNEKTDFWTFARDTRAADPNWVLVATGSG